MKLSMGLTPGSESAEEAGRLNDEDAAEERNPSPGPPNNNQCCHYTAISLGKQQV